MSGRGYPCDNDHFGYIVCEDTHAVFKRDIFLSSQDNPEQFAKGQKVTFVLQVAHYTSAFGTFSAYRRLVESSARVICESYNGMLVGPQNNAAVALADFVSAPNRRNVFGWLSPKIFLVARKS